MVAERGSFHGQSVYWIVTLVLRTSLKHSNEPNLWTVLHNLKDSLQVSDN